MRLNLGCGEFPADGWTNVDIHPELNPDVVADLTDLPFDDGSAEAVYAGHVLEHIALENLPKALAEIDRVLVPGGTLMVVGPDLDKALEGFPEVVDDIRTGPSGEWQGAAHLWDCTETLTVQVLTDAGWKTRTLLIGEVPEPWPVTSRIGWQFAIEATR